MTADIWNYHRLVLKLDNIAGGLPTDPRLIEAWQQANWRKRAKLLPEDPQTPAEAAAGTVALLEGVTADEAGWTTFARGPGGYLCVEGRQIKAMLKESANIMKSMIPINGKVIPLRSKLAERVFVVERLIPFLPETNEPTRMDERPIHVMTAQGPRDAIKRSDVMELVELVCTLKVLRDGMFTVEILRQLLSHAADNGLGADRSQGYGRFDFTLD